MEVWQGFVGLGLTFLGSVITWWFASINKDKDVGVKLAYDSEKTAESLKKTYEDIKLIKSDYNTLYHSIHNIEESLALSEQREQNRDKSQERIENNLNKFNEVYTTMLSEIAKSNNNVADAINNQTKFFKQQSYGK